MGLLSKEAFTSEKLAQINFSHFLLEVTTFIVQVLQQLSKGR